MNQQDEASKTEPITPNILAASSYNMPSGVKRAHSIYSSKTSSAVTSVMRPRPNTKMSSYKNNNNLSAAICLKPVCRTGASTQIGFYKDTMKDFAYLNNKTNDNLDLVGNTNTDEASLISNIA